ncbi:MAG: fused MFS/spermidine synthase [Pseudomonadota bacterium]
MTNRTDPSPAAPLWLLIALQAAVSAASLVVEIVAGRMIAPYVGMSLYTWTAIIAVVLAGFSIGHVWGGRIAARETAAALRINGWIMLAAAASAAGAALLLRLVAGPVLETLSNPLLAITTLTALVFFLPSLFAGVPAPVLAVVAMRGRADAERTLGAMFAAGAIGAIAGTLLAGFLFISWLGSIATLAVIAAAYAVSAALFFALGGLDRREALRTAPIWLLVAGLGAGGLLQTKVCDRESQYFCIRTVDLTTTPGNPVRLMVLDHLAHGVNAAAAPRVMHTDHTAMLDALPRMRMGETAFSSFHIGGGSYSVPRAWADRGMTDITVAEIDPAVTRHAIEDFWFAPEQATVLHQDARRAMRQTARRYDVIVGDAFTDVAVPAHLVSAEFFRLVADRLTPEGVFAMNVIDGVDRFEALTALVATLRGVFPNVEVWTEARPPTPGERRVFVLLAGAEPSPVSSLIARTPEPKRFAALDPRFIDDLMRRTGARALTDDYAPIDRLIGLYPATD